MRLPSCSLLADSSVDNPCPTRATTSFVWCRGADGQDRAVPAAHGWKFTWVSRLATDFNDDAHVTMRRTPLDEYNLRQRTSSKSWAGSSSTRGATRLSVFWRDGDRVFHTYSAYERGLDHLMNIYNYLDLTHSARIDDKDPSSCNGRHHDRYPAPQRTDRGHR